MRNLIQLGSLLVSRMIQCRPPTWVYVSEDQDQRLMFRVRSNLKSGLVPKISQGCSLHYSFSFLEMLPISRHLRTKLHNSSVNIRPRLWRVKRVDRGGALPVLTIFDPICTICRTCQRDIWLFQAPGLR